jgi:hypothetical protein
MRYNQNISEEERIRDQFQGFCATPEIPSRLLLEGMEAHTLQGPQSGALETISENLPLGKRAEIFASHLFLNDPLILDLESQIQFSKQNVTIGEIDFFLVTNEKKLVHLELAYKLYLEVPTSEGTIYVGPNRKDFLHLKLAKLQERQLPLLFDPTVQKWINERFGSIEISQKVYIKAQLFRRLDLSEDESPELSGNLQQGYWCDLNTFSKQLAHEGQYFIPEKQDWFVHPERCEEWFDVQTCINQIREHHFIKRSPMIWIKRANGSFTKCFVIWWELSFFS